MQGETWVTRESHWTQESRAAQGDPGGAGDGGGTDGGPPTADPGTYVKAALHLQVLQRVTDLALVDQAMALGTFLWTDVQEDLRKEVEVGTVFNQMTEAINFLKNRPTDVRLRLGCVDPGNWRTASSSTGQQAPGMT
jgi:hypothetical protein